MGEHSIMTVELPPDVRERLRALAAWRTEDSLARASGGVVTEIDVAESLLEQAVLAAYRAEYQRRRGGEGGAEETGT
jgi:hypothetical protein